MTKAERKLLQCPTPEQCSGGDRIGLSEDGGEMFACWYPQMGGYVARAVIVLHKATDDANVAAGHCFDVYVWHDGQFPFNDDYHDGPARRIHHCSADQFIQFGEFVNEKQALVDKG